jgi:hypothetical protein
MATVKAAASAQVADCRLVLPMEGPLYTEVECFGRGRMPDRDNMAKPILDALQGVVYQDDAHARRVTASCNSLDEPYYLTGARPLVLSAFAAGEPFVYIRVSRMPLPVRLPS